MMKKILAALAVASLAATPALAAQANPAAKLSLGGTRVSASSKHKSDLQGAGLVAVVVLGAGAIAGIVIAATDDNKAKSP